MISEKAKWIWINREKNCGDVIDEHAIFCSEFEYCGGEAFIDISVDSNYSLFINGQLASFGQYADYPTYKVYNTVDIAPFTHIGTNKLVILAWYYGENSQTYIVGRAGLIYQTVCDGIVVDYSSEKTLSKLSSDYISYNHKIITSQLGLSYKYDANGYDGYLLSGYKPQSFSSSVEIENAIAQLYARPIKNLTLEKTVFGTLIDSEKQIYDLGSEVAGFLQIEFLAQKNQEFIVAYGEHVADGEVRYNVRNFTVELVGSGKWAFFADTFRRLGCRYLQIIGDKIQVKSVGINPVIYPLVEQEFVAKTPLLQRIYDVSVRTLRLCMHEHYEDTPWREQALYTMDSRNQMLCGYYAFNEFEFPRANLLLMSKGRREDKLLPLCFPSGTDCTIPFFSLIYIVEMYEYAKYSKDNSLLSQNITLLQQIVGVFIERIEKSGLISNFKNCWNFYEWSDGLDGVKDGELVHQKYEKRYELPLMCFTVIALKYMKLIEQILGLHNDYDTAIKKLQNAAIQNFYDEKEGMFFSFLQQEKHYSKLVNALAILADIGVDYRKIVAENIKNNSDMVETTLSMKMFEYDALLYVDANNKKYILAEIEKHYGYMLEKGATSFWETIKGESDFNKAGSLCHGWSAIPVYYLWQFDECKK